MHAQVVHEYINLSILKQLANPQKIVMELRDIYRFRMQLPIKDTMLVCDCCYDGRCLDVHPTHVHLDVLIRPTVFTFVDSANREHYLIKVNNCRSFLLCSIQLCHDCTQVPSITSPLIWSSQFCDPYQFSFDCIFLVYIAELRSRDIDVCVSPIKLSCTLCKIHTNLTLESVLTSEELNVLC